MRDRPRGERHHAVGREVGIDPVAIKRGRCGRGIADLVGLFKLRGGCGAAPEDLTGGRGEADQFQFLGFRVKGV